MRNSPQFISHRVPLQALTPTPYGEGSKLVLAADHYPTGLAPASPDGLSDLALNGRCNIVLSLSAARALIVALRVPYCALGVQWVLGHSSSERWKLTLNTPINYSLVLALSTIECRALADAIERTLLVEWNPEKEAARRAALGHGSTVAQVRMI